MATSKDRSAQRVLIDFSSGPIHCRSCGAAMRPSEGHHQRLAGLDHALWALR